MFSDCIIASHEWGVFFFFSFGKARSVCKAIDGERVVCDGEITCGRRGDEVVDEGVKCALYSAYKYILEFTESEAVS